MESGRLLELDRVRDGVAVAEDDGVPDEVGDCGRLIPGRADCDGLRGGHGRSRLLRGGACRCEQEDGKKKQENLAHQNSLLEFGCSSAVLDGQFRDPRAGISTYDWSSVNRV
jgi:hypothetical protein